MEQFPANSKKAKVEPEVKKKVERVTSGEAKIRKKPLSKQFASTFIGGDARSAGEYMIFNVLVPAAKDALADAFSQGFEKLIFGESRTGRRSPVSQVPGHISYNRFSGANKMPQARQSLSRRARANHEFGEIVLQSRAEAEQVIERLFDIVERYDTASVADLYELIGITGTHTDHKWGWSELRGADVARIRDGYLLDLPEPEPFE